MPRTSRKDRELALRHQIIFEAAEAVLAEHGYHRASVDEIAKRAEVSVGTLYNLFGSKDHLYSSLLERGIEKVRGCVLERVAAASSGIEKLHAAIDAIFGYCAEHERAFRVYVAASHGLEWNIVPQFGEGVFRSMQAFRRDITVLCRQAVREQGLPKIDPAMLAASLLATINAFVTQWATQRRGSLAVYRQGAHAILEAMSAKPRAGRPLVAVRKVQP